MEMYNIKPDMHKIRQEMLRFFLTIKAPICRKIITRLKAF